MVGFSNSGFASGFGNKFSKTGKFGKSGRKQIKAAGYKNVKDFKKQTGINRNMSGSQIRSGVQPTSTQTQAPSAIPHSVHSPTNSPSNPFLDQANDISRFGAEVTTGGQSLIDQSGLSQNANLARDQFNSANSNSSESRSALLDALMGLGNTQISAPVQQRLDANSQARLDEIDQLFRPGGSKMSEFDRNLERVREGSFGSGTLGSSADIFGRQKAFRDLTNDRAGALINAGELSRQEYLNELNNQRNIDLQAASLRDQLLGRDNSQALNFLQQSNNAFLNNANSQLNERNLGLNILTQGLNAQDNSLKNQLLTNQQNFDNQMNLYNSENSARQQLHNNLVSRGERRRDKQIEEMLLNRFDNSGGGFWSSLGNIAGGIGGMLL